MPVTITNKLLIEEAAKYGIGHEVISDKHNLIILKAGKEERLIRRSVVPGTSAVVRYIADHKDATYELFEHYGFSVPKTVITQSQDGAVEAAKKIGYPVVVKPEDGAHGEGVSIGLKNKAEVEKAFRKARRVNYGDVIVQSYIPGEDFRILIVNYKMVAVAKRIPCRIYGDGERNIRRLIKEENKNPLRSDYYQSPLTIITVDEGVRNFLKTQGLELNSVPKKNQEVQLRQTANLSTGGESEDFTDLIPKENKKMLEEMARAMDANVVGIDIRCKDITKVLKPKDYAIIEVNASPGIRMHHFPSKGKSRNVAREILKTMFPNIVI